MIDYFPLGLAGGEAFCNREAEREHLSYNISHAKPTLITSPRRYGKTSLALQVINTHKLPFTYIDFFPEISQTDIENSILNGIGTIILKIIPTPQRALKIAQDFFSEMRVKILMQKSNFTLEFEQKPRKDNLKKIFVKLEELLKKYEKKVILFLDEFQRICQVSDDTRIEGIIRQVAQQSKNIIFIFSGSNRHLLSKMFDDRARPFYKLCDRLALERISKTHYQAYINYAATKKWKKPLSIEAMDSILSLTECHSYYVNLICSRLWRGENLPNDREVNNCWEQLILEERSRIASEIDLLSNNQRKLLFALARSGATKTPLSKGFSEQANLPTASIAQSLAALQKADYIYRDQNGFYKLLDPLMNRIIGKTSA